MPRRRRATVAPPPPRRGPRAGTTRTRRRPVPWRASCPPSAFAAAAALGASASHLLPVVEASIWLWFGTRGRRQRGLRRLLAGHGSSAGRCCRRQSRIVFYCTVQYTTPPRWRDGERTHVRECTSAGQRRTFGAPARIAVTVAVAMRGFRLLALLFLLLGLLPGPPLGFLLPQAFLLLPPLLCPDAARDAAVKRCSTAEREEQAWHEPSAASPVSCFRIMPLASTRLASSSSETLRPFSLRFCRRTSGAS